MNRVRRFDTPFIFRFPAITREFLWLTAIEVHKGLDHAIARGKERRLRDRLEEPPPHDLESFFRVSRSPWRLDAPKDILKAHSRFPATFAAGLGIRGWNGGDDEGLWRGFGRLCQRLSKAQIGIKGTTWQTGDAVQLARIDYPFVDKDEAWSGGGKEFAQHFGAWADALTVRFSDKREAISTKQLPGQFTPQRIDDAAIWFSAWLARGKFVANENGPLCQRRPGNTSFIQYRLDPHQVADWHA